ncbi:helix-turn-helix domain-containing protein [Tannockella kyphosi]|uniref:helix-turn-helix domain-containing protein n=1 Tax=Tannockella kyphosi TaxID=2899121 RepID=UPI002012422B|nr:helix-turn-helix transcriptional regulator [Tannockella kyphosi]
MANKKEINIEIGARVKYQRERAGFTQEKFAELLEMETNSISALERGVVGISLTTMKKICILLSISADELLFDITPDNNVEAIASRLRKLSPNQFEVANDIISKLLEAFSTK